jgi:Ca2+-binding RTX toxin-like protein
MEINMERLMVLYYGTDGAENITGTENTDYMYGNVGNDTLIGAGGNDFIYGGVGADKLQGGAGSDLLDGQNGNDVLQGDAGNDTLVASTSGGSDTWTGGAGNDTYDISLLRSGQVTNTIITITDYDASFGNALEGRDNLDLSRYTSKTVYDANRNNIGDDGDYTVVKFGTNTVVVEDYIF